MTSQPRGGVLGEDGRHVDAALGEEIADLEERPARSFVGASAPPRACRRSGTNIATALLSFGSATRKYWRVEAPPGMGVAFSSEANARWTSSSSGTKSTTPAGMLWDGRTSDTALPIILLSEWRHTHGAALRCVFACRPCSSRLREG